ncbi:amino acid-binding ACT protein [[Clostridium] cellulosi]|jgi:ACT domain.|uniref:aspartate kinase n=1 Tax=[Clostridium] cellulosi TaxID=29343 RepID=A0A078KST9_9FIRM|nr:amino acid-binding ACT protein [[Clostridium] cellulosi]
MGTVTKISTLEDVALITLRNSPADIKFIAGVFKMIAGRGVNVDMISQTAPQGGRISLSFTVSGDDLGNILELFAVLRNNNPELKSDISSGNCKISIYGDEMRSIPGVAAEAFDAIAKLGVDVRLITTSEVDISILVPKADFETAYEGLLKAFDLQ